MALLFVAETWAAMVGNDIVFSNSRLLEKTEPLQKDGAELGLVPN